MVRQLLAVTLEVKHELEVSRFVEPSLVVVLLFSPSVKVVRIQGQEAGEKGTQGEETRRGEKTRQGEERRQGNGELLGHREYRRPQAKSEYPVGP